MKPIAQVQQVAASQMPPAQDTLRATSSATADQPRGIPAVAEQAMHLHAFSSQGHQTTELSSRSRSHEHHELILVSDAEECLNSHSMGERQVKPSGMAAASKPISLPESFQRRASFPAQLHASPRAASGAHSYGGLSASHQHEQQNAVLYQRHSHPDATSHGAQSLAAYGLKAAAAPPEADKDVTAKKVAADVWGIHLRRYSGKY